VSTQQIDLSGIPPAIHHKKRGFGQLVLSGIIHLLLILAVIFALLPVALAFLASFKSLYDFYDNPLGLPAKWEWHNYTSVWREAHIADYARNSVIVTFVSVPLIVILSCLAGYGLTRYKFRFSRTIYLYFLAGLLIPIQLTILPSLLQMKALHLVNTHAGLITLYTALGLPFSVFLMAGFMNTMPGELSEAARLDGAGELRAFWDVVVPRTKPALATVAILNGVSIWNEFFLALILSPGTPTLQVGINNLRGYYSTEWGYIFAGVMVAALPVILAYVLLTKQFIRGLTAGALKG
jgi:raffinose/stachyose/melibiose transport system permease protein